MREMTTVHLMSVHWAHAFGPDANSTRPPTHPPTHSPTLRRSVARWSSPLFLLLIHSLTHSLCVGGGSTRTSYTYLLLDHVQNSAAAANRARVSVRGDRGGSNATCVCTCQGGLCVRRVSIAQAILHLCRVLRFSLLCFSSSSSSFFVFLFLCSAFFLWLACFSRSPFFSSFCFLASFASSLVSLLFSLLFSAFVLVVWAPVCLCVCLSVCLSGLSGVGGAGLFVCASWELRELVLHSASSSSCPLASAPTDCGMEGGCWRPYVVGWISSHRSKHSRRVLEQ